MAGEIALSTSGAIIVGYDYSDMQKNGPEFEQMRSKTKSYRLPAQHKIGIITYRQNRLMDVLWKDIIEDFVCFLPNEPLNDVADYLNLFMETTKTSNRFKYPEVIENHLINLAVELLETHISAAHSQFPSSDFRMDEFAQAFSSVLQTFYAQTPKISAEWTHFIERYYPLIEHTIRQFPLYDFLLPELVLSLSVEQLAMSVLYTICHGSNSQYDSEIAFFGYGESDEVPGLFTLKVQSVFEENIVGKLGIASSTPSSLDENTAFITSLKAGTKGDLYHQKTLVNENLDLSTLLSGVQTLLKDIVSDTTARSGYTLLNNKHQYIFVTKENGVEYYKE